MWTDQESKTAAARNKSLPPDKLYYRIGEVARIAGVKTHVIRFWESEFKDIKPVKTKSNHRLYRKKDLETILKIKELLYLKRFTIEGAKKALRSNVEDAAESTHESQLNLDFVNEDFRNAVKADIEELKKIKDMLS